MITEQELEKMKNADIRTVDPDAAIDIKNIKIDFNKSVKERFIELTRNEKNPYFYKCGDYLIQLKFSETDRSIEDCFSEYISTLT